MNKEWVEQKEAEREKKIAEMKQNIIDKINSCEKLDDSQKKKLRRHLNTYKPYDTAHRLMIKMFDIVDDDFDLDWIEEFVRSINITDYIMALTSRGWYRNQCLDSKPKEFDGDIIITDPCYITRNLDETTRPKWSDYMRLPDYRGMSKKELEEVGYYEDYKRLDEAQRKWDEENPDDWIVCECGYAMENLDLKTFMTRSTIYGDWSCTTFNSDTKEVLGKFCADAGQVGVFDLNEVLAYNPEYDDHIEKDWCVTVIKDFKGTVQFVVEENERKYGEDFCVKVVGKGVNRVTGEPLNFITSQTGL